MFAVPPIPPEAESNVVREQGIALLWRRHAQLRAYGFTIRRHLERRFLQLQGGQAHGICEGDQFVVYTIGSGRPLVTGTVKQLRPLTSNLEISDPASIRHKKGCVARALTHLYLSLKRYPIQLSLGPPCPQAWSASEERQYLSFRDHQHPFSFRVFADESSGIYRIRDNVSGQETKCSSTSMGSEDLVVSPSRVLNIAERLAKYQLVRDLANRSGDISFEGLYKVSIIDQAGNRVLPGTLINATNGAKLSLTIENTGTVDLYIHIYNLVPLGQVKNIQSASYSVVPPRNLAESFTGELTRKFRLVVPQELVQRGFTSCEDTIKVFITSKPTSFASLEMQSLDDSRDRSGVDAVHEYALSVEREDWVSLNFRIRTVKEPVAVVDGGSVTE